MLNGNHEATAVLRQLAAVLPILWLVFTLGTSRLRAHTAALTTWMLAVLIALTVFSQRPADVAGASLEGALFGLIPILWVILAAIYTYKLTLRTGAMKIIQAQLAGVGTDPRIQVLLLAWGFGGFLEAVSGYGTSVAIPAGILILLGFSPLFAATICLLANTVPTAFGAVGIAITTLARVTELPAPELTWTIALQLAPLIVCMPFVLVLVTARTKMGMKGLTGMKGMWGPASVSGIAFVLPHLFAARFLGEMLPTLLGSLAAMGALVLWTRRFPVKGPDEKQPATAGTGPTIPEGSGTKTETPATSGSKAEMPAMSGTEHMAGWATKKGLIGFLMPWLPYLLLILFILTASPLFPSFAVRLGKVATTLHPYPGTGGSPLVIRWLSTPGTLIFVAAVIGSLLQGLKPIFLLTTFRDTVVQMWRSMVTVIGIVALAKVMGYSGMVRELAMALAAATGPMFPLISPFIGMLGTFMTGSDTSSNVLFGALQTQVAQNIGVSPVWLASANTAGATAGKMISPQSIAVATAAAGLNGMEGRIFRSTIRYAAVYIVLMGLLIWLGSLVA